jgi:tRNA threonylcarbamoyladenosine biosynthesis protein TsaE
MTLDHWQVTTESPEETRRLGKLLGRLTCEGLEIFLDGELGSGKTCLTQGIASGLGVPEEEAVTSPTYTLMNQYRGRCKLHHFDFYRLNHREELDDIDFEECVDGGGVAVIEWASQVLEPERPGLHVALQHAGDERRILDFTARGPAAAGILEELTRRWAESREEP